MEHLVLKVRILTFLSCQSWYWIIFAHRFSSLSWVPQQCTCLPPRWAPWLAAVRGPPAYQCNSTKCSTLLFTFLDRYLVELSLMNAEFLNWRASMVAAAAVALSRFLPWLNFSEQKLGKNCRCWCQGIWRFLQWYWNVQAHSGIPGVAITCRGGQWVRLIMKPTQPSCPVIILVSDVMPVFLSGTPSLTSTSACWNYTNSTWLPRNIPNRLWGAKS